MAKVLRGPGYWWADLADSLGLANAVGIGPRLPNRLAFFSHHKCGTVWLGNYLSEFSKMNGFTYVAHHESHEAPSPSHDVTMLANSMYHKVKGKFEGKALHVIRNPMSILVSAYHSHLASHPLEGAGGLKNWRNKLSAMDTEMALFSTLALLENVVDDNYHGALTALKRWDYDDPNIITVRMEDLTVNISALVTDFLAQNKVRRYKLPKDRRHSFESITRGRKVGEVDPKSHFRSGDPNGWRHELPARFQYRLRTEYAELLKRFYPEAMS